MKKSLVLTLLFFVTIAIGAPNRSQGLSLHMLPTRVAKIKGHEGGFSPSKNPHQILADAQAVMDFLAQLPPEVSQNGIWVVYTHPAAYTPAEAEKLDALLALCRDKGIPVFTCRAANLPNGWKAEGFKAEG